MELVGTTWKGDDKDGRMPALPNAALISASPDLLESTQQMLRLVDGLPWELRDAVYKAFNERTGGLPGTLPTPITNARKTVAKATAE